MFRTLSGIAYRLLFGLPITVFGVTVSTSPSEKLETRFCQAGHQAHGSRLSVQRGESSELQAIIISRVMLGAPSL